MDAHQIIEAYVTDVAVRLPRRQRNDVAFELRALLQEQLQDRAEGDGRAADAAMALALVQQFGAPREVAARYAPTLTVIDPADGPRFVKASAIGLLLIWGAGLLHLVEQLQATSLPVLVLLGQWWTGAVLPSLWWPGVLVLGFGLAAWSRRRRPQAVTWTPRSPDRIGGGRVGLALAMVGIVCGVALLMQPSWILDVVWQGRAAPAAYAALTYTETFRTQQAPWLFGLVLLNLPLLEAVMLRGRWTPLLRKLESALAIATCAAMAWVVLAGPVMMRTTSDQVFKGCLLLTLIGTLVTTAVRIHRQVRPMASPSCGPISQ